MLHLSLIIKSKVFHYLQELKKKKATLFPLQDKGHIPVELDKESRIEDFAAISPPFAFQKHCLKIKVAFALQAFKWRAAFKNSLYCNTILREILNVCMLILLNLPGMCSQKWWCRKFLLRYLEILTKNNPSIGQQV